VNRADNIGNHNENDVRECSPEVGTLSLSIDEASDFGGDATRMYCAVIFAINNKCPDGMA